MTGYKLAKLTARYIDLIQSALIGGDMTKGELAKKVMQEVSAPDRFYGAYNKAFDCLIRSGKVVEKSRFERVVPRAIKRGTTELVILFGLPEVSTQVSTKTVDSCSSDLLKKRF